MIKTSFMIFIRPMVLKINNIPQVYILTESIYSNISSAD